MHDLLTGRWGSTSAKAAAVCHISPPCSGGARPDQTLVRQSRRRTAILVQKVPQLDPRPAETIMHLATERTICRGARTNKTRYDVVLVHSPTLAGRKSLVSKDARWCFAILPLAHTETLEVASKHATNRASVLYCDNKKSLNLFAQWLATWWLRFIALLPEPRRRLEVMTWARPKTRASCEA